jgi:RNA polymerase sigma-70 factor (ECF subfamily)
MPTFRLHATHEDAALVKAVTRGNANAFKILVHKYEKLVCSIVFKMIEQKEDREDICQDVFLKVYDKLSTFRFQSKLSTWIGNIAFNTSVNFLKKKKAILWDDIYRADESDNENVLPENTHEVIDMSILPDEVLLNKEKMQLLNQNILGLPVLQQTILQLFHNEDLSLDEIATIATLPVNTVKSHLFRARNNLKNKLLKQLNK